LTSSIIPIIIIIDKDINNTSISLVIVEKRSNVIKKDIAMDSPPNLGIGFLWTRLLSLGTSIAPILYASLITNGVTKYDKTADNINVTINKCVVDSIYFNDNN
jgi:hypothetical protein